MLSKHDISAKFLRFAENIKPNDQVTFKVSCDRDPFNYTKLLQCDCKRESMQVRIETDYMNFKDFIICVCCDKQYQYLLEKLNVSQKNLYIYQPCIRPELLNLLNNQVWDNIQISDTHNIFNSNMLDYLPRTKHLIWQAYKHSETLKYGLFILHNCKETEFVIYHVQYPHLFKTDLEKIGIQMPNIQLDLTYDVLVFRDVIEIYKRALSYRMFGYNIETHELENLTLAYSIEYKYEDLNL